MTSPSVLFLRSVAATDLSRNNASDDESLVQTCSRFWQLGISPNNATSTRC